MKPEDFEFIRILLKNQSGLSINSEKIYLLESRLTPLARRRGLSGLDELLSLLRAGHDTELVRDVTDAMTTNESFFFRDQTPFENLEKLVFPELREKREHRKSIRIWCAAASSGQEPYSIAMMLKENEVMWEGWRIEIVATDISRTIIDKARQGLYSQFEVQRGLPVKLMIKYFTEAGEQWKLSDEIRHMIHFKEHNLLGSFTDMGGFDIIFCRNVLIYFDATTKGEVLGKMAGVLADDGSLFLGAAEMVLGISEYFKPEQGYRGVYRKIAAMKVERPALAPARVSIQ